jgi:hypothetical protein
MAALRRPAQFIRLIRRGIRLVVTGAARAVTAIEIQGHIGRAVSRLDAILGLNPSQLFSFRGIFAPVENSYDVLLFDCAPSMRVVQTAALIYAQRLLIPVATDILAIHGALACLETAQNMNEFSAILMSGPLPYSQSCLTGVCRRRR